MNSIPCEHALKHFVFLIFGCSITTELITEKLLKRHLNLQYFCIIQSLAKVCFQTNSHMEAAIIVKGADTP